MSLLLLLLLCNSHSILQEVDLFFGKINSANVRMIAIRLILKALAVVIHKEV